jgi:hypothetical protein
MNKWQFNTEKTKVRFSALKNYYKVNGLSPDDFHCRYFSECSSSQGMGTKKQYAGGTACLMPFYDVAYNGKEVRVLIIGEETGYMANTKYGTFDNLDIHRRTILNCTNWRGKNNHIKGTLITLQRIFEAETEYIYASFALSNLLRCAFQAKENLNKVSNVKDTPIMRRNCLTHLIDEIKILDPTLIIIQGSWALGGQTPFINRLAQSLGCGVKLLKSNKDGKYGLYQLNSLMCITTHHPALYGRWIANWSNDSLWPMLDYLKKTGYLPSFQKNTAAEYEKIVKSEVDSLIVGMPSNDILRQK